MVTVIVCAVVNSGLLLGLLGGLVVGVVRARGAIVTALASDPAAAAQPIRAALA